MGIPGITLDDMDRFPLIGLVVTDQRGLIVGWTPGAERLLGHSGEQALGEPAAKLLGPADMGGGPERHMLLPLRHRAGHLLTMPVSRYPLAADPSGSAAGPAAVLVIGPQEGRDSQQGQEPRRHRDRRPGQDPQEMWEARAGWVLEASPMALTVYDTDLRCVWQSSRMRSLTGMTDAERRGLLPTEVLTGPEAVAWEERMRLALVTGEEQVGEIKGSVLPDSDFRVYHVWATPLRDGLGQIFGVCATVTDMTEASRARERLALLNDASVRIGSTLDVTRTAQELTEVAVPRFSDFARVDLVEALLRGDEPARGPIEGAVRLRRMAELNLFKGVAETRTTADDADVYLAGSPAALCLASGRSAMYRTTDPVIQAWVAESPARQAKVARYRAHSWMLVPVRARGTTLGVVMFCRTRETPRPFEPDDLALAEDLVARAAVCLDNARRFTRERAAALALQRSLLPKRLPRQSAVQVASRYLPALASTGVGGDWFDVIPLSGARVALVVGDVVGHGIHAAAAMGRLRTAVRTLADVDPTPDELLTRLDDLVLELATEAEDDLDTDGSGLGAAVPAADIGATCLYAVYDPVSGRCSLARAGHPAPILVSPDGTAEFLSLPAGPPLGLGGVPFESRETVLPPGSLLALYTDGLVESRHHDLEVGLEGLRRALTEPADSLEGLCDDVVRRLLPNGTSDDVALLLVRSRMLDARRVAAWDVPAEAAAVARMRAESIGTLESWGLDDAAFVTELVVSELLTNAIRYGGAPIELRLIHDEVLTCEVSDSNSTAPHMRRARVLDEGGRGLPLVAQLTQRWGTRQTPVGKTIWCEQTLPAGARAPRPDQPASVNGRAKGHGTATPVANSSGSGPGP